MSVNVGEVSLERLEDRSLSYQRQAILGSLAAIIAHEYRNLLSPVFTRAQDAVARDDVDLMRRALAVTVRQTQKVLDLTEQLLEIGRGKELPMGACRLVELVEAAITSAVRPFEKDKIDLELCVADDLQVAARPVLFEQLMLNLLLNARSAMKPGGGRLSITGHRDGDMVVIDVRDSGVGMSPEMLSDVINPFLEADPTAQPGDWSAIGLGLHACRTIARQHGAKICALANDGPGCTFRLGWPAA